MEELKMLVSMVADLPNAALWVIAAVFVYKVCIVGSIYGVIRLAIVKAHSWATTPKVNLIKTEMIGTINGMAITGCADDFVAQLNRLRGKGLRISSQYVHSDSVEWLRDAINEKEARERAAKKPLNPVNQSDEE